MEKPSRYLVTAALPYANGPLHIGHLAGAYLPADIYVRFLRLIGEDILFICGSDEHGAAITIQAKKEGLLPQQIVDKYHEMNKDTFSKIGLSFDIYHRTSDPLHHETSSEFFLRLYDNGVFKIQESDQFFDEQYGQFLADRYIIGQCPHCQNPKAYGDQCESCGKDLSPGELINPRSILSDSVPVLKKTVHWYLPMGDYQDWVDGWIEASQEREPWKKHVYGQCRSWLKQALHERAMTRDLDWGVKVPLPDAEGKVLYVWLDAPIGYITATKALTPDWEKYWKDDKTKIVHFIGKDNIVFHCIIFPILLKAHGEFSLPWNIPANQFMNLEGQKVSTSRNHAVWIHEFLENYPDRQDELRYVLIANMPENKDSDFTWSDFGNRVNKELVGILGGFVSRTLTLLQRHCTGVIPERTGAAQGKYASSWAELDKAKRSIPGDISRFVQSYEFRNALDSLLSLARAGNKFLNDTAPWKSSLNSDELVNDILSSCMEVMVLFAIFAEPFLPFTAAKLRMALRLVDHEVAEILEGNWSVFAGKRVGVIEHLFERVSPEFIQNEISKLASHIHEPNPSQLYPLKDFSKLDVRTGTIQKAEILENYLLKLLVDIGDRHCTVVSNIGHEFAPETLLGRQVVVWVNVEPKTIGGVLSEAMLIMASDGIGHEFLYSESGRIGLKLL